MGLRSLHDEGRLIVLPLVKKTVLAAALGAGALVSTSPAMAQHRRHHGDGDDAAIAVGAGVLGIAVGAAIASDHGDRYYYDRGYYGRPYRGDYYYYRTYPRYHSYYRDYDRRDDWRWRHHNRGGWNGGWNGGWHDHDGWRY
jgi:hypothetical protein